jgi:hypothetical protein
LRAEFSARPKPEIPCSASDCSSWPTAKTARGGYEIDPKTGKKVLTLEGAACSWPGPTVSDTNGAGLHGEGAPDLRTTASMWTAPQVHDVTPRGAGIGRTRTGAAHVWHGVPRLGRHRAR